MKIQLFIVVACAILMTHSACDSKNAPIINSNKSGTLKIKFDHIVGDKKLVLNDFEYRNVSNETYKLSKLKYYISNIRLKNKSGAYYTVPKKESFFLIDQSNTNSLKPSLEVPEGDYSELTFNLGVDSLTNTLDVAERTGVLEVTSNDMYWGWNSGYIFFKFEGSSPQASTANKSFQYHIGLYGGYNSPTVNNNRIIRIDLQAAGSAQVKENLSADIHLMVDLSKVFDSKNTISIKANSMVMTSGPHSSIADNYATMFSHDHTHNFQKLSHD